MVVLNYIVFVHYSYKNKHYFIKSLRFLRLKSKLTSILHMSQNTSIKCRKKFLILTSKKCLVLFYVAYKIVLETSFNFVFCSVNLSKLQEDYNNSYLIQKCNEIV